MDTSDAATEGELETELPHAAPAGEPTWCENYCFDIHDRATSISMWLHVSRSQLHPDLWREVINVFLPDGTIGVWKGYGSGLDLTRGPSGPTLSCEVVRPFEELTLRCVGVVQIVRDVDLREGPLRDGIEHAFELDLTWRSVTPVWDLRNDMADQLWASGHYEQGGRVHGSVGVGGRSWRIDATAWRDHSLGPRNNALMQDHDWAHAIFPSGRAFAIFRHARMGVGEDLRGAFVSDGCHPVAAELVRIAPLNPEMVELDSPFEIVLETEAGCQQITADVLRSCLSGSAPPAHQTLGRRQHDGHVRWESQTLFTWDGEQALGITERTKRLEPAWADASS